MQLNSKGAITARGAQRTRDEHKKLSMYSKQWLPGDTLRVFYPIVWNDNGTADIVVGAVWGHRVADIKTLGLKTAFIPSLCDFDEDMNPIGVPDITYQFSQIAKVFVDGQQQIEEAQITSKPWPTEAARKEALEKVKDKFDAKNNMKAVKPIIGRLEYYITTEVGCIKVMNDVYNMETAAIASTPMSNSLIDKLYTILADPKYAPAQGEKFLEVEWKYPVNADKGQSGKAATPAGLTPEYRLSNVNPLVWEQLKGRLEGIAFDSETIAKRATRRIDEHKIRQALTQYVFFCSEYLDAATDEGIETLCRHANVIHELDAERAIKNENLIAKIKDELAKTEANQGSMPDLTADAGTPNLMNMMQANANATETTPEPEAPVTPTPDLSSATTSTATSSAPGLAGLMNNPNNLGNDMSMNLDDINLDM